jgi:hypothetical protein
MSKVSIAIAAAFIACVTPVAGFAQSERHLVPPRQLHTQSKRAPLANEGRRIPIDDCIHVVFPACSSGP